MITLESSKTYLFATEDVEVEIAQWLRSIYGRDTRGLSRDFHTHEVDWVDSRLLICVRNLDCAIEIWSSNRKVPFTCFHQEPRHRYESYLHPVCASTGRNEMQDEGVERRDYSMTTNISSNTWNLNGIWHHLGRWRHKLQIFISSQSTIA